MTEQDLYLRFKGEQGLKRLGFYDNQEYRDRLLLELDDIASMKFASYFLVVADYVGWARSQDIPVGPGRGSGAGSLVAYATGITEVDPIRWGLMWERFLNKGRLSMPDFDIDFCMRRRSEVIDYVVKKYGADQVAAIGTVGTMKARLAVRDTARALGVSPEIIDSYGKLIPEEARGGQGDHAVTLAKCLNPDDDFVSTHYDQLQKFRKAYDTDKGFNAVVNRALEIEGFPKSIGTHAAGIVIWDKPLASIVPLTRTKEGIPATQWCDKEVESIALVKYDFLGLRTLTVIYDAEKSIEARTGVKLDWKKIPEDDPAVFQMLSDGDTFGVFQLAEEGMRDFTNKFKPRSIEGISAISALFRPGPRDNGMVSQILKVRSGQLEPQYPIEALREILEETDGVLTYQEQVLAISRVMAGYTLGEADLLRRAIGKKLPLEMAKQREAFVRGCVQNKYSAKIADEMFSVIEKFADYCFNKSHSVAYSILSYRTAYLKCHYPADFYAALMSSYDELDKIRPIIANARSRGLKVLPPDINTSNLSFTVSDPQTIRFGLVAIRGCGDATALNILEQRKIGRFTDMIDFCRRIDPSAVRKNNIEALVNGGAFDEIEPTMNRQEMLAFVPALMEAVKGDQTRAKSAQTNMFDTLFTDSNKGIVLSRPKMPMDRLAALEREREAIGLFLSGSPLDVYRPIKETRNVDDIASLELPDLYVCVMGILSDIVVMNGKKGQYAIAKLEDELGTVSLKIWSKTYDKIQELLQPNVCVIVTGKTNEYRGIEIVVDSIQLAEKELARITKPIVLTKLEPDVIQKLTSSPLGKTPVDLEISGFRFRLAQLDVSQAFI